MSKYKEADEWMQSNAKLNLLSPHTSIFLVNNSAVGGWHDMYIAISQYTKSKLLKLPGFVLNMYNFSLVKH